MKNLRTLLLCTCITFCSFYSSAQNQPFVLNEPDYNKPRLFDNLPDLIPVSLETLDGLVNSKTGAVVNTTFATDVKAVVIEGMVVSSVSKYEDKVQTVMIRSTNLNGATLYFSKVITADGTIRYNGRLMSFQHGDVYVLRQKDGGFVLAKKNFYDVINE